MRIGIINPSQQPEIGGGFTYSATLSDASSGFEFGHDIVYFGYDDIMYQYAQEQHREREKDREKEIKRELARETARQRRRDLELEREQEINRAKISFRMLSGLKRLAQSLGLRRQDPAPLVLPTRVLHVPTSTLAPPTTTADAERRVAKTSDDFIGDKFRLENLDLLWLSAPMALFRIDLPYAVTVWDLAHRLFPFFPEVSTEGWLWDEREDYYRTLLPRATYVFVGSKVGAQQVQDCYNIPIERIRIIPLPTPNMSGPLSQDPLPTSRPFFFYPAQFWSHKNHVHAINALKLARDRYNLDIDLIFTGADQGNEPHIRRLVEQLGLGQNVHFMGFVSRDYIRLLYARAEALLYLSLFGPDNLPPLEAFAMQCAVIAADHAGHREQLEDAALFVDPLDDDAIAKAMFEVVSEKALKCRLTSRGKSIAEARGGLSYLAAVRDALSDYAKFRICWQSNDSSLRIPQEVQIEARHVAD